MAFHEVLFPATISYGAVGGPEFKTTIVTLDSGHERRNIDWSVARGQWDVQHGLKDQTDLETLIAFFRAREGMAHGFRFKDWTDYTLDRQIIGTTDTSTTTFQIYKRYTSSVNYDRDITKVLSGAESVWVNNVAITEGGGAGEYQLNDNTGIVTLGATLAAQSGTNVEVALTEFHVPARFGLDKMNVTLSFFDLHDWPVPIIETRDIV